MLIDSSLEEKNIRIRWSDWYGGQITLGFYDNNWNIISSIIPGSDSLADKIYKVPLGTRILLFYGGRSDNGKLFEIHPAN